MSASTRILLAAATLAAVPASAAFFAGGKAIAAPIACEIVASRSGAATTLQGIVHADHAVQGSYSLRVASFGGGGSSTVSQGGVFEAGPDGTATLGTVMIGAGAAYEATLTIDSQAGPAACSGSAG